MKFVSIIKRDFLVITLLIGLLINISVTCLKESKSEDQYRLENWETADRTKHKSRGQLRAKSNPPISNTTNLTVGKVLNSAINNSLSNVDLKTYKDLNQNYKFHSLFDKQLEELFFIFKNNKMGGVNDFRSAYALFTANFVACDKDKDTLLNAAEFAACLKMDPFLRLIMPTDKLYALNKNITLSPNGFASSLFILADNYDRKGLNLYDYVILRLIAFSWRKCSVNGPFMDESSFECAIDIVSGSRSLHSNSLRKLFELAIELGNSRSMPVRTIDFIMYYAFATSARLFGKINSKEDMDATRNEFNVALDTNILPTRYNQKIIDDLFRLIKSSTSPKNGIDLYSFCFYDHFLKLFYQGNESQVRWSLSLRELNMMHGLSLFPQFLINYLQHVPNANYTADSYNLRRHINPVHLSEDDNFMKFLETGNRNLMSAGRTNFTKYNQPLIINRTFALLDSNEDGFISFYDFGLFVQTFYLYDKADVKHADRVLVGNIYTKFSEHTDLPLVSEEFRERSKRFNLLEQDTYIDPFYTLAITRMDDIVGHFLRKSDPTTVKEIELNLIFEKMNLKNFPSQYISKCNRGKDEDGIPKYDWECAITKAIQRTLVYLEHVRDDFDTKSHGLNLTYTVIDSSPTA